MRVEELLLESLAMALTSLAVGALFAVRFRVLVVIVLSIAALVAAIVLASVTQDWHNAMRIIILTLIMQAGYVVSAMIQAHFRNR